MPREGPHHLTIRELVEEAGLGLTLVGGHGAVDNAVNALYVGDLEDPTPWMVEGSLLLTTGPMLRDDPAAGPHLVKVLRASDMGGVGVAILPHVDQIPAPMIEAADRLALPLLRVPPETPFRDIASYVHDALSSRDLHGLRRSLALQNELLEASSQANGVESLVDRLGSLLSVEVFLLDATGDTVAQHLHRVDDKTVDSVTRQGWRAYRRLRSSDGRRSVCSVGPQRFHFREITVDGRLHQLLMAALPPVAVSSDYMEAGLTFSQRLLELAITADRTIGGMRRRTRAGLLHMVLEGRGSEAELEERLLGHGMRATEALWIAVIGRVSAPAAGTSCPPRRQEGLDGALLSEATESTLEDSGVPFLSLVRRAGVIVLSPFTCPDADSGPREFLGRVVARVQSTQPIPCVTGVSAPLASIADAPRALAQAMLAQRARRSDESGVILFEELGIGYAIVDRLPDSFLGELAHGIAHKLAEADSSDGTDLLGTLRHYLESGRSVSQTATRLFLHRNTLRARLKRIERVLDLDLSSTDGLIEARLGLLAAQLLEMREEATDTRTIGSRAS